VINQLRQKMHTAHAALGYAIINDIGIQDANIALDNAIDEYYDHIQAVNDARAVNRYLTLFNASTECQSCLNAIFGGLL